MGVTAFTSAMAGPNTAKSIDDLRRQGLEPVVVTEEANRRRLRDVLERKDYANTIVVRSFRKPIAAADELSRMLRKHGLHFSNWINITDDTTAFFLHCCEKIGLEFEFRHAYERCRIKPLARGILAKAGLGNVRFRVHDITDPRPPDGFLFPFVAKPILGAGSKGVEVISGPRHWLKYLRRAKASLKSDDVSISGFTPGRQVLVEEILAGQECQLDGFVDRGRIKFCTLGVKAATYQRHGDRHGFREVRGMLYSPLALKDSQFHDKRLMEWCTRVLRALEFKSGTFHIEAKVNGPDIHLLEVNPRPGGGANVPVIELLSGVNLNQECFRLWAGLPRVQHAQPKYFSMCFSVRYPSKIGKIVSIRRRGPVSRFRTSENTALDWHPIAAMGQCIDPRDREQYLGVLLAADFCKTLEDADAATRELENLAQRSSFVREAGVLPRYGSPN